jgi:hypothetical protein
MSTDLSSIRGYPGSKCHWIQQCHHQSRCGWLCWGPISIQRHSNSDIWGPKVHLRNKNLTMNTIVSQY